MRMLALALAVTVALGAAVVTPAQNPETPPPTTPPTTPPPTALPPPPPPAPPSPPRWFTGGGFGATFGTVDSISVAPLIGFHATPRIDVGSQLYYRWINDDRYTESVSTDDYGLTLFTRARVFRNLFLEADVEYANYEYLTGIGTETDRTSDTTFLAGGGYTVPVGRNASFYFSVLYDFGYDDDDLFRPYDDPWRVQVGATVGF